MSAWVWDWVPARVHMVMVTPVVGPAAGWPDPPLEQADPVAPRTSAAAAALTALRRCLVRNMVALLGLSWPA